MTQEEKQLLLKDLCARLLYGLKLRYVEDLVIKKELHIITLNNIYLEHIINGDADIKPYLRPMSSMTEEERAEMGTAIQKDRIDPYGEIKNFGEDNLLLCTIRQSTNLQDWLNKKMFDYRGLIPMGLAIEAPNDMYN